MTTKLVDDYVNFIMDRMTKPESKFKDNSFHIVSKDDLIEVWLGEPNDGESEYIFSINKFWLPELIDALEEVR